MANCATAPSAWTKPPTRSGAAPEPGRRRQDAPDMPNAKPAYRRTAQGGAGACASSSRASSPARNRKGQELKTNVTDPDSAKMATSKGVIQGYAAQAAVDSAHQVIVAADVTGSGSEQAMLLPMIGQSAALPARGTRVDHGRCGLPQRCQCAPPDGPGIPALIADNQMRQRDERFENQGRYKAKDDVLSDKKPTSSQAHQTLWPQGLHFNDDNTCTCPAGQTLTSAMAPLHHGQRAALPGLRGAGRGLPIVRTARAVPEEPGHDGARPQVTRFAAQAQATRAIPASACARAIDSLGGMAGLYSQRIGTVEPVFANIRHNKRLHRLQSAWAREGEHAVAPVLHGAQH
jgi:hypothetical protein